MTRFRKVCHKFSINTPHSIELQSSGVKRVIQWCFSSRNLLRKSMKIQAAKIHVQTFKSKITEWPRLCHRLLQAEAVAISRRRNVIILQLVAQWCILSGACPVLRYAASDPPILGSCGLLGESSFQCLTYCDIYDFDRLKLLN